MTAGQHHQARCRTMPGPESRSISRRYRRKYPARKRCRRLACPRSSPGNDGVDIRHRRSDRRTSPVPVRAGPNFRPARRCGAGSGAPEVDGFGGSKRSARTHRASVPGLADVCSALLSASATALAERVAGSFSSINWPGAKICSATPPSKSTATNIAAERQQQSRAKRKAFPHSDYSNSRVEFSLFKLSERPI